ncbi:hypothetical protein FZC35_01290 [Candidatus Cytomitobacter indipagum]|uniref:Uncharacterized protein n=1 Tax=Candidatus Cytomitobacter indipagum TaxID=2601575 RepID=A0A5C0UFH5_9PROT|nr:hypothetical protein [Candidatus Cytomitobacter indipagum]QEK38012.1 hypothetical protein FZC35_01290 [Candidatus Cytomitobacter indipagum]
MFFLNFHNHFIKNDNKMHSNYEVKSLVSQLISAQEKFEQSIMVNSELKKELGNLMIRIVNLAKSNHASKDLLEKLTHYMIEKK